MKNWLYGFGLSMSFIGTAQGAAFQLQEQSASLMGTAFSGTAVLGQDAATAFYNPAGLVNIAHQQVSLSNALIVGATHMNTNTANTFDYAANTVVGTNDNPKLAAVVPGLYYANRLNDRWAVGLSTTVPFGLKTEYSATSYVRYLSTLSEITAIDVSPSIAYKPNDQWSFGAGFDALFVEAKLNTMLDLGGADSISATKGEAWGYAYHAGLIYNPTTEFKIGGVYRAYVPVKLHGNSTNQLSGTQLVQSNVTLPESVVLSTAYRFQPRWSVLTDIAWTRWSRIQKLTLDYENGSTMYLPIQFEDSWRVALGLDHQCNDKLTWRFGTAFEQSPVKTTHRTPRVPDSNRIWLSTGARYTVMPRLNMDLAYGHIFFHKAAIDHNGAPLSAVTNLPVFPNIRYQGMFKTQVNMVGLQLSWDYV